MKKTSKMIVGITAGLALLAGPTAVFADTKAKAKKNSKAIAIKDKSKTKISGNTSCGGSTSASGLVAVALPVNACDVLDLEISDSLNNLLKNLLAGGLL